ncbi:hypothetical protein HGA64_05150, partial [Candidatus Falkowbacteria bacterium]|nr:hypothetical protein [Candidatus Falkowbacteria bacterium]
MRKMEMLAAQPDAAPVNKSVVEQDTALPQKNKREGGFIDDADVARFLDEADFFLSNHHEALKNGWDGKGENGGWSEEAVAPFKR